MTPDDPEYGTAQARDAIPETDGQAVDLDDDDQEEQDDENDGNDSDDGNDAG